MPEGRFAVIGTAGHIDHGKTALVAALTGKNTDRLKEEQERGISIDIDFAPLRFSDGTLAGIVDVPGHERFIRNMVAGAAGIDAAMLVIDAREGVKPQTVEHMAILKLLGVAQGIVVLTKVDLVDVEWLEMARDVVREELEGTVFEDAPILSVSAKTGYGLDNLKKELHDLAISVSQHDWQGGMRLPVDKVFSVPGFGTVVSGTLWRGSVHVSDTLECLPNRTAVRVRGIQVHKKAVETAVAGQRVALNLTGVQKSLLRRGVTIAATGTLAETQCVDVDVSLLADVQNLLHNRDKVHFYLGTAEVVGRVLLLEDNQLSPGKNGFAQILLDGAIACEAGDRFVLRSLSPVATIGGGRVLNATPKRLYRRRQPEVVAALTARQAASPEERLLAIAHQGDGLTVDSVMHELGASLEAAQELLDGLVKSGELIRLPSAWFASRVVDATLSMLAAALQHVHMQNRLLDALPKTLLLKSLPSPFTQKDFDWLLSEGAERGLWKMHQATIWALDWQVRLHDDEASFVESAVKKLKLTQLAPLSTQDLLDGPPPRSQNERELLQYASRRGLIVELATDVWLHHEAVDEAVAKIRTLASDSRAFTLGEVRDALGTGRKLAVLLLEYLDRAGVTVRKGDARVLR